VPQPAHQTLLLGLLRRLARGLDGGGSLGEHRRLDGVYLGLTRHD